jgi:hypothetical protein
VIGALLVVLVVAASLAMVLVLVVPMLIAWITAWPDLVERPYACRPCRVAYTDARALGWHQVGQHPVTYGARDHELDAAACGACGAAASGPRCLTCGAPFGADVDVDLGGEV